MYGVSRREEKLRWLHDRRSSFPLPISSASKRYRRRHQLWLWSARSSPHIMRRTGLPPPSSPPILRVHRVLSASHHSIQAPIIQPKAIVGFSSTHSHTAQHIPSPLPYAVRSKRLARFPLLHLDLPRSSSQILRPRDAHRTEEIVVNLHWTRFYSMSRGEAVVDGNVDVHSSAWMKVPGISSSRLMKGVA
ncbi:hypothetical protein CPC08DRAFT_468143 [Agrocybe pediades]|nr:hypothetical protein CPC08DRAFT_468143 [Agrocybe pediades]